MGFHHVAFATRDLKANHEFYTRAMGFKLAKVVAAPTEAGMKDGRGWSKHLFYDTGDGTLIAFWDLHDETIPAEFPTAISEGIGLPVWVNHLAFDAPTLDALAAQRTRWLDYGLDVLEVDHGFCVSIYTRDPNGILVEFCTTTKPLDDADARQAEALLADPHPPLEEPAPVKLHRAKAAAR
jgi:catechol 2,3-dioxygenase-like lactoylglutathione lyase family enzyme